MDEIFAKCDYITLHIPYIPATKHTINAETIAKMKDGVRIINLARGELVNDDDILAALENGKVAKYVTDFPNGKTAGVKNIVAMPHLGASTPESEDNCAVMAALELADYIENGNIKNSVNMPTAVIARTGDPRLCIIHRNIPNVIAKVTEWISAQGINIENMVNASLKGKPNAYTIIDMDKAPENSDKVSEIEGVIRMRIIK
jgi:D-3-phosphoglycerate dehydrogenase